MNRKTGYMIVIIFWLIIFLLLPSCAGTYWVTDYKHNHINCIDCNYNNIHNPHWDNVWKWWYTPTYTNYVIVKPNNKPNKPPNRPNNRPNFNNNSNNSNNNSNSTKPNRKPRK